MIKHFIWLTLSSVSTVLDTKLSYMVSCMYASKRWQIAPLDITQLVLCNLHVYSAQIWQRWIQEGGGGAVPPLFGDPQTL